MNWLMSIFSGLFAGLGWAVLAVAIGAALAIWIFGRVLPAWVGPLVIALLGFAFVGSNMAKTEQINALRSEMSKARAEAALAAAEAQAQARAIAQEATRREHALTDQIDAQAKEARHEQQVLADRLAAADRAAGSLREQLRTISRAYADRRDAADRAATAAADLAPASAAVGMLADLYQRCDSRAGALAGFADAAHAAGRRCEADYDAARAALK